jgi:hypothetical protein
VPALTLAITALAVVAGPMGVLLPASASALPYQLNLGYADSLRPNPVNFPTPWVGSPNVIFEGCTPNCTSWDGGAAELVNTSGTSLSVGSVVFNYSSACTYDIWPHNLTLPANDEMIFTELATGGGDGCTPTQGYMDSSDIGPGGEAYAGNCTQDALIPQITVTVNGTATVFNDTGQILNTGGADVGDCGRPNNPSATNESQQWAPVGDNAFQCSALQISRYPSHQDVVPGVQAALTATVTNNCSNALAGIAVGFDVAAGPNAGTTGSVTTNSGGDATFKYGSTKQGIDTVDASVVNEAGTIMAPTSTVIWETAALTLSTSSTLPGNQVNFTGSGYTPGESVRLSLGSTTAPALTTVVASSTGTISGSFVVPVPTGPLADDGVVALGETSAKQGWAVFNPMCTTDWTNQSGGNFNTASDWSEGTVPGASDLACILDTGTYTVAVTQGETVGGLIVGTSGAGTQTLNVEGADTAFTLNGAGTINKSGAVTLDSPDGNYSLLNGTGTLTNNGTFNAVENNGSTRYLRVNIVNGASGTMNVSDFDTRIDSGNTLTNDGTLNITGNGGLSVTSSSTLVNAGTLSVTGQTGLFVNGATIDQNGGTVTGSAALQSSTLNDAGGGGGTFVLQCSNTLVGTIPASQTVIVHANGCGSASTTLAAPGVINDGTLGMDSTNGNYSLISGAPLTNNGTFETLEGDGGDRYVRVNITNAAGGTTTIGDADTLMDQSNTLTNNGTLAISGAGGLSVTGGGTVSNAGSFAVTGGNGLYVGNNGTFDLTGGTVTGSSTLSGSTLNDTGGNGGTFILQCSDTLTGTVPTQQTVTAQGNGCGGANMTLAAAGVTNDGTLNLDSNNGNFALLQGGPLTNAGTFTSLQDNGGIRYLRANITNTSTGTTTIGDFSTVMDSGNTFTNNGTLTNTGNGALNVYGGSTFAQNAGSVSGTVYISGSGTLADSAGTGGTFDMQCSNTLSGTIPATQTVTVLGDGCGSAQTNLAGASVENQGTLNLDSNNGNYAMLNGGALTNDGTIATLQDAGGPRYLRSNITNNADGTINAGASDTVMDNGNTLTNSGTLVVPSTGGLSVYNGSTFVQSGGSVSGQVGISGGGATLTDSAGTGGTFLMQCGSSTLSGTIPATQTVTVQGNACGSPSVTTAGTQVTNNGTLNLDSTNGNSALIGGSPIVNSGTFATLQDGGGTRYVRANVTNGTAGSVKISAGDTRFDSGNTLTNNGTVALEFGGELSLTGGSAFTQGTTGTLGVAITVAGAHVYGITGGTDSLAGKLHVTTTGTPASGTMYNVISGATLSGTFSSISSTVAYTPSYSSSAVTLTAP